MIKQSWLFILILLIITTSQITTAKAARLPAKVLYIQDPQTVFIQLGSNIEKVRLACIKVPNPNETPFYDLTLTQLKNLLPIDQPVQIRLAQTNRIENRLVLAELYREKHSVNLLMVRQGVAIIDQKTFTQCSGTKRSFLSALKVAKEERIGLWNPTNSWKPTK